MNKISGIYKIQSKIKPERCYVGSAVKIDLRWTSHINSLKRGDHHSVQLQRHYLKYGESDLLFSILLGCDKEDLIKNEQYFIDSYNPYFNTCLKAGNCLGKKHSQKAKEKMRLAKKGKYLGKDNPNYGRHLSDDAKQKIREARTGSIGYNKGKKFTEEQKQNMSNAKKGNKYRLGVKASDITKQKIGKSKVGNKYWLGRHHTEETKKKLSIASKKDWALKKLIQTNSN